MNRTILKLSLLGAIIALPAAAAGLYVLGGFTTTGLAPEAMRQELAESIVDAWSGEGAQAHRVTRDEWAERMHSTLANADIANLERAASAPDLATMNAALMGAANPDGTASKLGQPGADLVYTPLTPCRIVDTRVEGGPIPSNGSRTFLAFATGGFTSQGGDAGNCGVPENVSALTVKVTASRPVLDGFLTVYPTNEARPLASSLNFLQGEDTSNESHFRLCRPACPTQFTVYTFAQTDVVVDVTGYFVEPEASALDCTVAQQTGNLDLLGGLQARSVSCPAGYTATGGGCGGPLGITVSNSQPQVTNGQPSGWSCDLVGSLLSVISYQVSATCCRTPGR